MAYSELTDIGANYPPQSRDALLELAEYYRRRSEVEILELAATSADLAIDDIINLGREPDPDPQLLEAFHRYTNKTPESLVGESKEYLDNFIDSLKGIYFEVLVRDRLNAGETLGELQLELGQVARLAGDTRQEGWDLEIVDQNGATVEQIQLKATESMSYVKKALAEYPDFRVAVPEDIDSSSNHIIGTGISHKQLQQVTEQQVGEISEGTISNVVDHSAEFAVDVIPVTSALVIVVIEGRQYMMGRATLREAMRRGGRRLARSSAYSTVGTALAATSLGVAAIPIVMSVRVAEGRIIGRINLYDNLKSRTAEIERLIGLP